MLAAERVLLYSLSLALGAFLVREISRPNDSPELAKAVPMVSPRVQVQGEGDAVRAADIMNLTDAEGTPRLVISLNKDGSPRLVMNDAHGRNGLELSLSNDGTSLVQLSRGDGLLRMGIDALGTVSCRLSRGETRQQFSVEPSGVSEWRLSGKSTDPEAVIRLDPAGRVSWEFQQVGRNGKLSAALDKTGQGALQLIGEKKTFAQMFLASNGEVEIGVGGGPHGIEALLRTDQVGAAEVALSSPEHSGGPRLSMFPSGEMGVRVLGAEGQAGPVMQLLKDGSAEITIVESRSQRGPVMFRGKDGACLIGIRGEKGKPGPRMYQGADMKSLISLPGIALSQVGLHSEPMKQALLVITGADGKPIHLWPQDAIAPVLPTEAKP